MSPRNRQHDGSPIVRCVAFYYQDVFSKDKVFKGKYKLW